MESVIERFIAVECGGSRGDGDGAGRGVGAGTGFSNVNGDRLGDGSGSGDHYGNGLGFGLGNGSGNGFGRGDGFLDGLGFDNGFCNGYGGGSVIVDGSGSVIKSINGMPLYHIDDTPIIIEGVHGDYAKGYIVQNYDPIPHPGRNCAYLRPCYIAKGHGLLAHGNTLLEARETLEAKWQKDVKEKTERQEEEALEAGLEESGLEVTGTINGHDYVDLGLSVKWATCNLGASSPEDYGDYYAWGETSIKSIYTSDNNRSAYVEFDIGGFRDLDAACANWGGTWRMPTQEEMKELCDKCAWRETAQGDKKGYQVTGPNGNRIFLPFAGERRLSSSLVGESGTYRTSTPVFESSFSYTLTFYSSYRDVRGNFRNDGFSIRPVSE